MAETVAETEPLGATETETEPLSATETETDPDTEPLAATETETEPLGATETETDPDTEPLAAAAAEAEAEAVGVDDCEGEADEVALAATMRRMAALPVSAINRRLLAASKYAPLGVLNLADVPAPSVKPAILGLPARSVTVPDAMSTTRTTLKPSTTRTPPGTIAAVLDMVGDEVASKPAFVPTPTL